MWHFLKHVVQWFSVDALLAFLSSATGNGLRQLIIHKDICKKKKKK